MPGPIEFRSPGWPWRRDREGLGGPEDRGLWNDRARAYMIFIVSTGWMINLVAPVFVDSYDNSLAANGPLLLILGSLFAAKRRSK